MLSIAFNGENGNGKVDPEQDAKKRERRNTIRRIRRAIRKDGMDLHHHDGEYYPVSVHRYSAIDAEQYGRKVGAIQPIGICAFCHRREAWQCVDNVPACDGCAAEVRS